jgi:hypothetical protein
VDILAKDEHTLINLVVFTTRYGGICINLSNTIEPSKICFNGDVDVSRFMGHLHNICNSVKNIVCNFLLTQQRSH